MIINYWLDGFKRYFDFQGRATRAQFWSWFLVNFVIVISFFIFRLTKHSILTTHSSALSLLDFLYILAILIPLIAYIVRRLHDANLSGAYFLLAFIFPIGDLILIVLLLLPSKNIGNRFGPHPLTGEGGFQGFATDFASPYGQPITGIPPHGPQPPYQHTPGTYPPAGNPYPQNPNPAPYYPPQYPGPAQPGQPSPGQPNIPSPIPNPYPQQPGDQPQYPQNPYPNPQQPPGQPNN